MLYPMGPDMLTRCPACGFAVEAAAKQCPKCLRTLVSLEAVLPEEKGFSVPVLPPLQGEPAPAAAPARSAPIAQTPAKSAPASAPPAPLAPAPLAQESPAQAPNSSAADFWSGEGSKTRVVPQHRRRALPVLPEKLLLKIAVAVTAAVLLIAAYFALR